jgi:hypothetical protein
MVLFFLGVLFWVLYLIFEWEFEFLDIVVYTPFSARDSFQFDNFSYPWLRNNIFDEIMSFIVIISGLVWSFSKEKLEDELITEIRKSSLVWAVYINYGAFLLATLLIYGLDFLSVPSFNLLTLLLFFNIRFEWLKYKHKNNNDEE